MTEQEFCKEFEAIYEDARVRIVKLMERTRGTSSMDGYMGESPVYWYDHPNWERKVDAFIELGGWVHDRINGKNRTKRGSVTTKLRKALGYTP